MDAFIIKSLKRIKRDCPRRMKDLRTICDSTIVDMLDREKSSVPSTNADDYFEPFRLACESGIPKLMDFALDSLHFLIERGYLRGSRLLPVETTANSASQVPSGIPVCRTLMDLVIVTISKCADESDDNVQLQVIKALLTAITSLYCEVHEASLLLAIRSCFHIHLVSKNTVNKTTAKAALTQMLSIVNMRMETFESRAKVEAEAAFLLMAKEDVTESSDTKIDLTSSIPNAVEETTCAVAADAPIAFPSIMHKDAFLIFRALCKLSMKGLHEDAEYSSSMGGAGDDQTALQNKILSLDLIQHILLHSGSAFRCGERFIFAIRHYLCVSLLSNCTSHVNQITGISLQIFVVLIEHFKDHLKSELEVFITNIFLRILESENSSYDHKISVLEVFHKICSEPSALVEIFMNYDCDLEAIDLFRRIVDGFSRIAKNPGVSRSPGATDFLTTVTSNGKKMLMEDMSLRSKSLEGLVIIFRSLLHAGNMCQNASSSVCAQPGYSGSDLIPHGDGNTDENVPLDSLDVNGASSNNTNQVDSISVVEIFDRKQKMQEELETGILKFNLSPKKGLAYLVSLGHLDMTASSVALFLHNHQDRLDKTAVGEYLGREREYEKGFCLRVLHEYVNVMQFGGMPFDSAIRSFLSGFRLPGEAQKIDRIMEKFAERYFLQNRDTFVSADMAFILAFSTIMLQTNLHNPAIREDKRMTKEQFVKQNKGISSDGELSDEMLMEIYDRIAAEPIAISAGNEKSKALNMDKASSFSVFQASSDKRRKDAFNSERKEMVRVSEAIFKQKSGKVGAFLRSSHQKDGTEEGVIYVKPMFEVVWAPALGVLSQLFETYDDPIIVEQTLKCVQYAIKIACHLDIPTARMTYVNMLCKFTTLGSVREIVPKNIESIALLLDVASTEGDMLEESWGQLLQSISQLARLQLFASGLHTDDVFFCDTASVSSLDSRSTNYSGWKGGLKNAPFPFAGGRKDVGTSTSSAIDQFSRLFGGGGPSRQEAARLVEEANAEIVVRNIDPVYIDKIFMNSQNLSASAIGFFVKGLCEVSMLEISSTSAMHSIRAKEISIFSLQKIVEVADFNLGTRSRLSWSHIWGMLASHFSAIGVHDNHALAMYAIDSLKQLSIKFLQKDELSNFNFQAVFLKPFHVIISKSKSPEIKDLVLRCIDIMIQTCSNNIRSGWKTILAIFESAASQNVSEIAMICFEIIDGLVSSQFELFIYDFVDLMHCLVSFVSSTHTTLSLSSLSLLSRCADHLASGSITPALVTMYDKDYSVDQTVFSSDVSISLDASSQISEDASVFRLWWPLLLGLSARVGDFRFSVRFRALETLGSIVRRHGHLFSPQAWDVIFKGILFPMIDSAKFDETIQSESSGRTQIPSLISSLEGWIDTMTLPVLNLCIDLFRMFHGKSGCLHRLADILGMIESCMCQDIQSLARLSLDVFADFSLLLVGGSILPEADCSAADIRKLVCSKICDCIDKNMCFMFLSSTDVFTITNNAPSAVQERLLQSELAFRSGGIVDGPQKDGPSLKSSSIQASPQSASAAMTSLVISFGLIKLAKDILYSGISYWVTTDISRLLESLETMHWYARNFNDDFSLRSNILNTSNISESKRKNINFSHILEHEVESISVIVDIVFRLYGRMKDDGSIEMESFLETWIIRSGDIVLKRFMTLIDSGKEDVTVARQSLLSAYTPCLMLVLREIEGFSSITFSRYKRWIISYLADLIICETVMIRESVRRIYIQHVNPLI